LTFNREVPPPELLNDLYVTFNEVEPAFQAELSKSLEPRGHDLLLDIVERFGLTPGATAIDIGCGEGRYTFPLAERFGLDVRGIDPIPGHIDICNRKRDELDPRLAARVRFELGSLEQLSHVASDIDLVWCRDMLVHIEDLPRAFAECHAALRPGGHMLIYNQFGTQRLEPREGEWLWRTMGVVARNTAPAYFEETFTSAGFTMLEMIELRSELQEFIEEQTGSVSRELLYAARMLRAPERYIAQFGQTNFDMTLGDCLWHIYQMLGKLSPRIYVLQRPEQ
jgi:ubiquinone/menaquinone biosynthesis C-methylase UbiE